MRFVENSDGFLETAADAPASKDESGILPDSVERIIFIISIILLVYNVFRIFNMLMKKGKANAKGNP